MEKSRFLKEMKPKMTSGPIAKTILRFAAPVFVAQLLQQLYNIADTIIVGRYLGVDAVAAVGATWSLNYIIGSFCIGTCMGINVPLSQAYGADDGKRLRCYFAHGVYLSLVLAVLLTITTTSLSRPVLELLRTPGKILDDSVTYIFIIFLGLPFTILYNFCFGVLMAFGDSKKSSMFMALSTVLNLLLDLLMIVEWNWGVAGAAVSTVISQGIAGGASLWYILIKYKIIYPKRCEWKFRAVYMKSIVRMCVPMGLQYSVTAIGAIILQFSVNGIGKEAVASYSIGSKIKGFLLSPLNALGTTVATFVGQNFGAGQTGRIKEGVKKSLYMGIGYAFIAIVFIFFAGENIVGLFISQDNTLVIHQAQKFILYISVFQIELAVLFIFRYSVQGMGYGKYSIYSGLAEMAGRSVMAILIVPLWGFDAVCWSEGVTFLAGILVILPVYYVLVKEMKK